MVLNRPSVLRGKKVCENKGGEGKVCENNGLSLSQGLVTELYCLEIQKEDLCSKRGFSLIAPPLSQMLLFWCVILLKITNVDGLFFGL